MNDERSQQMAKPQALAFLALLGTVGIGLATLIQGAQIGDIQTLFPRERLELAEKLQYAELLEPIAELATTSPDELYTLYLEPDPADAAYALGKLKLAMATAALTGCDEFSLVADGFEAAFSQALGDRRKEARLRAELSGKELSLTERSEKRQRLDLHLADQVIPSGRALRDASVSVIDTVTAIVTSGSCEPGE